MGRNKTSSVAYNFAKLVARFQLMPVSKTRVREMHVTLHVVDMGMVFTATTRGCGEGDSNTCKLGVRLGATCILGLSFATPRSDLRVTPQTSAYE